MRSGMHRPIILHLSSSYFPRIGGLPSHVRNVAHHTSDVFEHHLVTRDLVRAGITWERYEAGRDESDPHITVHRFWSDGEYLTKEMRSFIAVFPHQVLMIHSTNPHLLEAVECTKAAVVFAPQCKTKLKLGYLARVDRIMALVPSHRVHFIEEHGVAEDKIMVLPQLVDVETFQRQEKGNHRLLYVGRIAPGKRVWLLAELLGKLRQADKRYTLRIVGDYDHPPRDEPLLREAIAAHKVKSSVKFSVALTVGEVAATYRQGDVFVSASQSETFGHTFLEALASGLPAVTTARGEVREWASRYVYFTHANEEFDVDEMAWLVENAEPLSVELRDRFEAEYSWQARKAEFVGMVEGVL